jgi:hypothetical protein
LTAFYRFFIFNEKLLQGSAHINFAKIPIYTVSAFRKKKFCTKVERYFKSRRQKLTKKKPQCSGAQHMGKAQAIKRLYCTGNAAAVGGAV